MLPGQSQHVRCSPTAVLGAYLRAIKIRQRARPAAVFSFSRSSDRTTCPDKPTEPSSHQKGCPSHPDGLTAAVRRLPVRPLHDAALTIRGLDGAGEDRRRVVTSIRFLCTLSTSSTRKMITEQRALLS